MMLSVNRQLLSSIIETSLLQTKIENQEFCIDSSQQSKLKIMYWRLIIPISRITN